MIVDLTTVITDWNDKPMKDSAGENLTLYGLIIPAMYTAYNAQASKEQKAENVKLADKIKDKKEAGKIQLTVDELKLVQDSIEPGLVPIASTRFCDILSELRKPSK